MKVCLDFIHIFAFIQWGLQVLKLSYYWTLDEFEQYVQFQCKKNNEKNDIVRLLCNLIIPKALIKYEVIYKTLLHQNIVGNLP